MGQHFSMPQKPEKLCNFFFKIIFYKILNFVKKCQIISDDFFLKNGNTYYDAMTNLVSAFSSYKIRLSNEVSNVFLSQGA